MHSEMTYALPSYTEVSVADSTNQFLVNVEVAIVRGDEYLMIVRGDDEEFGAGWLGMPGGKVDWNEPLADVLEHTARREVMEEVGLVIDDVIHYVESHTFGLDGPFLDVVVLGRPSPQSSEPYRASPGEVADLRWMTLPEILNDSRAQSWTRESLQRADQLRSRLSW